MPKLVSLDQIDAYQADGAVFLPGLLTDWVDKIRAGIERNMREPGPYAAENLKPGESGRFFDDYCNWQRIPEFVEVVAEIAGGGGRRGLMHSKTAQVFHDHVLVKEPGTAQADALASGRAYYFIDGDQTVSFWIPVDPVEDATLRSSPARISGPSWSCLSAGCRTRIFTPTRTNISRCPTPTPSPKVPGDRMEDAAGRRGRLPLSRRCTARAAISHRRRRRAFSLRWSATTGLWDAAGPHLAAIPRPRHEAGQRLREDWFRSCIQPAEAADHADAN